MQTIAVMRNLTQALTVWFPFQELKWNRVNVPASESGRIQVIKNEGSFLIQAFNFVY